MRSTQMSTSKGADISIFQSLKELENIKPKMTGQNGQNFALFCPFGHRKSPRDCISESKIPCHNTVLWL